MSAHPYVRAYLAGSAVPTVFLLAPFAFFCVARFVYDVPVLVERIIVFPLALVPNLWGLWNMLYVRLWPHRRLPLGVHGALLPLLLAPAAAATARALGFEIPGSFTAVLAVALPGLMIVYYLVWKYVVAFCNALVGIA